MSILKKARNLTYDIIGHHLSLARNELLDLLSSEKLNEFFQFSTEKSSISDQELLISSNDIYKEGELVSPSLEKRYHEDMEEISATKTGSFYIPRTIINKVCSSESKTITVALYSWNSDHNHGPVWEAKRLPYKVRKDGRISIKLEDKNVKDILVGVNIDNTEILVFPLLN